ncbi:MAG: TonB-dependent receptor [Pseudomonadota bacterium]
MRVLDQKRLLVLMGASSMAMAVAAPGAMAQDDATDGGDEIVVTGSRIARDPNLTEPLPVQSIDSEALRLSGEQDITEVINDIPALLTTTTAQGSIDGIFAGAVGGATLNLRGLGAERTLTLVNGRRHVGGVAGSAIVDINSIPSALIERVDVLTGGASQVYGADAVTGVVNFILKEDFEGLEVNLNGGISGEGDGERYGISAVAGKNFLDDRLNITVAFDYNKREEILFGDRDFSRDNMLADDLPNPAADGPSRVLLPDPRFSISSNSGVIVSGAVDLPPDFDSFVGFDFNNNGVDDCDESTVGQNSAFFLGGCLTIDDVTGEPRPYVDGIVTGAFNQFGGDGIPNTFNQDFLTPDLENVVGNLFITYDVNDNVKLFLEGKVSDSTADSGGPLNTFYDLLTVAPDNPFIPDSLQPFAGLGTDSAAFFITRDPTDLGPNINTQKRRVYRLVGGVEAEADNGFTYSMDVNYGRFERESVDRNRVIQDRFFAAVDAVDDGNGNAVCRSDIDPSASSPTTPFDIPLFDFGYLTFNPGDGQCAPYNVFGRGFGDQSQAAIDFITTTVTNDFTLEQFVVNGTMTGNLDKFFTLPGGSFEFATGFEYRDESSDSSFDPLVRGVVPVTTPDANAGDVVSELDAFRQSSLVFDPGALVVNEGGDFSVWEYFTELSVPLVRDQPFAKEITLSGGARFADYSTVGATISWGVSGTWAPIEDLKFRSSYAKPIRAPNITELFRPAQGATFRPVDPCDQGEIDALLAAGDPNAGNREANCRADGIPEGYEDPLSARFVGEISGNPELQEEKATTFSVGALIQPRFVEGLTLTVDYWSIQIEQAISAVGSQDIVDNCYDSGNFPNQFCTLFTRNRDTTSPQFLGFNFLRQSEVNFASLDARGIDAQASYDFEIGQNDLNITLNGTWNERLNNFFDPGDPTAVDPELGELQRPEFAANAFFNFSRGPFAFQWQTQFQDEQGLRAVEIETVDTVFGPAGIADAVFIHDLNASYQISDQFSVYGGVNNVLDRDPFITEQAYPVSPLGRYFFAGVNFSM